MLARATAATPWGIDARPVQVEVDVKNGLPQVQIVGLPDAAVRESRERVRSAVRNCGFDLPPRVVVVNLAPADLKKQGNHLDLAIALALLAAHGHLAEERLEGRLLAGELALDGTLRPVRGALAIADMARRLGFREVLVPRANAAEAAALGSVPVIAVEDLGQAVAHLSGLEARPPVDAVPFDEEPAGGEPDMAEVRGQETAKRALEIAAAGGHNLLFLGPPGCGKTMLARRLPALLPPLTREEALAVTKVHSLVAERPPSGLLRTRPFRSPHAGVSPAGMIGGGSGVPRPGEVSLAHNGVLFLDELPEFQRSALEALRQPLEEGLVTVVRARARLTFPARIALLAACNPCPCGYLGDPRKECRCTPSMVERYRGRVSGPLLDRIDLHLEVPAVGLADLARGPGEPTAAVAARVAAARQRQHRRFASGDLAAGAESPVNAALGPDDLARVARLDGAGQSLLDAAFHRLGLSARAVHRILKVARTIADLAARDRIGAAHVAEAIQYRSLDPGMEE
jgi:magnesium chelatase family protein